ncbi:MAG TPA: hypothetical protein VIY51_00530 [Xanthobacteraceae bacterium]
MRSAETEIAVRRSTETEIAVRRSTETEIAVRRSAATEIAVRRSIGTEIAVKRSAETEIAVRRSAATEIAVAKGEGEKFTTHVPYREVGARVPNFGRSHSSGRNRNGSLGIVLRRSQITGTIAWPFNFPLAVK